MKLANRVAIVTGAAGGLGREFCLALAAEGANIVAADINSSQRTVDAIADSECAAIDVITDVSSEVATVALARQAVARFGRIDILVNCAGIIPPVTSYDNIDPDDWDRLMQVNVKGTWLCSKAVIPHMKKTGKGKIINISSATIWEGATIGLHYVASKAAQWGITRALARELSGTGINVNCMTPGLTITEGSDKLLPAAELKQVRNAQNAQRIVQRDEIPADLRGTIVFLASDDSDFISGQTINVDGGLSLH